MLPPPPHPPLPPLVQGPCLGICPAAPWVTGKGLQRCPELFSDPVPPCQGTHSCSHLAKKPMDCACGLVVTPARNHPGRKSPSVWGEPASTGPPSARAVGASRPDCALFLVLPAGCVTWGTLTSSVHSLFPCTPGITCPRQTFSG